MHSITIIGGALFIFALWMWGVDGRWLTVVSVAWLAYAFNTMVQLRTTAQNSFASIEVMLKKRYNLIPGLVEAIEQYVEHDEEILDAVTRLRSRAIAADGSASEAAAVDAQMSTTLNRLIATAEADPELKSNEQFIRMQASLSEIEEQISAARRGYNTAVERYNDAVRTLPTRLLALALSYEEMPCFDVPDHLAQPSP